MKRKIPIHSGSGNVFADIGLPNPEEYLAKSALAAKIFVIVKRRRLSRTAAAQMMGVDDREVSLLLRGLLDEFSFDQLFGFLNILGCDVQITVSAPHPRKAGKVSVLAG